MGSFKFDFKVYGLEQKFINYVMKTYENTTNNPGILLSNLNGIENTTMVKFLANEIILL